MSEVHNFCLTSQQAKAFGISEKGKVRIDGINIIGSFVSLLFYRRNVKAQNASAAESKFQL